MVLVSRENKRKVYSYLLSEGVIVVKKDFVLPLHEETQVPNLHVWMLLRSLLSKGIVKEVFNWRYCYFFLKTEGLKFIRDNLGIVEENVVPITHKKTKKDFLGRDENEGEDRPRGRGARGRGGRGGRGGARGPRRDEGEVQEQQVAQE